MTGSWTRACGGAGARDGEWTANRPSDWSDWMCTASLGGCSRRRSFPNLQTQCAVRQETLRIGCSCLSNYQQILNKVQKYARPFDLLKRPSQAQRIEKGSNTSAQSAPNGASNSATCLCVCISHANQPCIHDANNAAAELDMSNGMPLKHLEHNHLRSAY